MSNASPYREPDIASRLELIEQEIERIKADMKQASKTSDNEFYLRAYPRVFVPIVIAIGMACLAGYSCNKDDCKAKVEAARLNGAEAAKNGVRP